MALDRNQAELIAEMFVETVIKSIEGNSINFAETHDPGEERFRALFNSIAWFQEPESRAKVDAATNIKNLAGLVVAALDTQAKTREEGIKTDKTLVALPHQLSSVSEGNTNHGGFNGNGVTVTVNPSVDTRDDFVVAISAAFVDWVNAAIAAAVGGIGGGEVNTASNVGTGAGVWFNKDGVDLEFRSINSLSSYITIVENGNQIDVDFDTAQFVIDNVPSISGLLTDVQSVGTGKEIVKGLNGTIAEIKSLLAGSGIVITESDNELALAIDAEFLTNAINTGIINGGIGGGGNPDAGGNQDEYQFKAIKTIEQDLITFNHTDSANVSNPVIDTGNEDGVTIGFENDYENGGYDYGKAWSGFDWKNVLDAEISARFPYNITIKSKWLYAVRYDSGGGVYEVNKTELNTQGLSVTAPADSSVSYRLRILKNKCNIPTKNIANIVGDGGTTITVTTSEPHQLLIGATCLVTITGTTNYNVANKSITVIDATTLQITDALGSTTIAETIGFLDIVNNTVGEEVEFENYFEGNLTVPQLPQSVKDILFADQDTYYPYIHEEELVYTGQNVFDDYEPEDKVRIQLYDVNCAGGVGNFNPNDYFFIGLSAKINSTFTIED